MTLKTTLDYTVFQTEDNERSVARLREFTDQVLEALDNGGVPNPIFKDWKTCLNYRVERLHLETATSYFMYIHTYRSLLKVYNTTHPTVKALKPWYDLYLKVKDNVVSARKPAGEGKPVYEAPMARSDTVKAVHGLLTKLTEEAHAHLKKNYINYMLSGLKRYVEERVSLKEDPWKYGRRMGRNTDHFGCLLGHRLSETNVPKPKEEQERICDTMGQRYADGVCDQFIHKNLTKLCSVVEGKTLVKSSYNFSGNLNAIVGTITLAFKDGTAFNVRNQIVTVWGYGRFRTVFNRFPTTFHDVKFADGTVKKMVPEKKMNEVWKIGADSTKQTTPTHTVKSHLKRVRSIRIGEDGKAVVEYSKSSRASCGRSASIGGVHSAATLYKIKTEWGEEAICKRCLKDYYNAIKRGRALEQQALESPLNEIK